MLLVKQVDESYLGGSNVHNNSSFMKKLPARWSIIRFLMMDSVMDDECLNTYGV
jgi:hypothetical protein